MALIFKVKFSTPRNKIHKIVTHSFATIFKSNFPFLNWAKGHCCYNSTYLKPDSQTQLFPAINCAIDCKEKLHVLTRLYIA